jgi:hypothetical protein
VTVREALAEVSRAMSGREYAFALASMGLSPRGGAVLLGVAPERSFRWVVGAERVPVGCERLILACLRYPELLRMVLAP